MKHELETVLLEVMEMYRYKGCIVTKLIGGWEVFGVHCTKPEEVDEIIQNACSILSESLVVVNNGNYACTNTDFLAEPPTEGINPS